MPSQAANAATCRTDGYKPRLYLSDLSGSVLATVSVDTTPAEGAIALTVTVLTGSLDNAFDGMRVVVANAGGVYKGTVSISYRPGITPTNLPIRELSSGEVPVEAGDVLTVYDDILLTDMLPAADLTFAPDSEGYVDQNDEYDPFVNSGGSWAGKLNASGNADVPFLGSASFLVDPDSSTPITHQWVATGSPSFVIGNSNSADPTLRWTAAGKYRVEHLITDPDNGQTAIKFPRVRVHDANDPPYEIVLSTPPTGNPETGFTFAFTLFDNPSIATLRDGAHVILWSDDSLPGAASPFGSKVAGRSHIVAEGFLRRDTADLGDGVNAVVFEVISPIARLAELPGFSKVFIRDQTPDSWSAYKSFTIKQALIALLRVYSNIAYIFDLIFDGYTDADYPLLYAQKQNPYEQTQELCRARAARLTCDRSGRLEIQGQLWDVPLTDRAAVTVTFTFTGDDCIAPLVLKREHVRPLELYRLRGFIEGTVTTTEEGTTAPVFAKYPANPARGGQVIIEERAVVTSTVGDVFARCSRAAAWANADYWNDDDRDAVWQQAPELTVTFPLIYARMFQFYREYCAFNVTAIDEYGRQVDLADFLWIPMTISEDYEALTCQVVFRAATYAPAFMSADDTPATDNTMPPWTPPDTPPITPPTADPVDPIPAWTGELPINGVVLSSSESKCARMVSFDAGAGTITYTDISTGIGSGTGIWYRSDPYNYRRGFALMTDGLYRCDDVESFSTWTLVADNAAMFGDSSRRGYKLLMDHKRQGWIMALSGNSGAGVSFNYGGTWTQVAIDGGTAAWSTGIARGGDAAICGHDANHLYSVVQHPSTVWIHRLFRSEDAGLSWTLVNASAPNNGGGLTGTMCLEIPYARVDGSPNLDDSGLELISVARSGSSQAALMRSYDRGANWSTKISATDGQIAPVQSHRGSSLSGFTHDSSYWWHVRRDNSLGHATLRRTTDDFANSSDVLSLGNSAAYNSMINGWPMNPDAAIVFTRTGLPVKITLDGGANWFGSKPAGWADGIAYAEFSLYDFIG